MSLLATINEAWGWRGIDASELIDLNLFGNAIVRTAADQYWRICPEELRSEIIADSSIAFELVRSSPKFVEDWDTGPLVQRARTLLGPLADGTCYCLKISTILGGTYDDRNLATIDIEELLSASGDIARQIDNVPDGGQVQLIVVPRRPN